MQWVYPRIYTASGHDGPCYVGAHHRAVSFTHGRENGALHFPSLRPIVPRPVSNRGDCLWLHFRAEQKHHLVNCPHVIRERGDLRYQRLNPPCEARRVLQSGDIKWRRGRVFVSESLAGELVGITEQEDGTHLVRFCDVDLGVIDRSARFRRFAPPRYRLREAPEARRQNRGGSSRSEM